MFPTHYTTVGYRLKLYDDCCHINYLFRHRPWQPTSCIRTSVNYHKDDSWDAHKHMYKHNAPGLNILGLLEQCTLTHNVSLFITCSFTTVHYMLINHVTDNTYSKITWQLIQFWITERELRTQIYIWSHDGRSHNWRDSKLIYSARLI